MASDHYGQLTTLILPQCPDIATGRDGWPRWLRKGLRPRTLTISSKCPAAVMGVFNNLVMYKQDMPQSGFQSIVPDLATDWSWDEDKTQLTFRLREGVKWHDGKPFTAKDIVCTWYLLTGRSSEKL